jgi:hypothetical protein
LSHIVHRRTAMIKPALYQNDLQILFFLQRFTHLQAPSAKIVQNSAP